MEAAGETLTYRDGTGFHRKLLPEKLKDSPDDNGTMGKRDESSYADLNMKPDGVKPVKVTFTGEANHLLLQCDSAQHRNHGAEGKVLPEDLREQSEDARPTVSGAPTLEPLSKLSTAERDSGNEQRRRPEPDPSDAARSESDELQYTDMYLNSKAESDSGASAVLSDCCGCEAVENEPHYITTHEIQPTELDDDVDYDQGRGTCWDFEDNNLVFSFVDYASFESDETQEGTLILEGMTHTKRQPRPGGAASSEQEESDLCDSDESSDKNRFANVGEVHLSIKASSRATKEPVSIAHSAAHEYTKDFGDGSRCPLVSSGAIAEPFRDRAEYFIPAPGRQHLATKLRRKDINEYSSGASSSISELDDADKEVRNLTAKSFRSLACPYFDAINLSTSSESSLSEYGLNKWSSYMDWNYGNITQAEERRVIAHKTSTEAFQMKNTAGDKRYAVKATQNKMYALHKATLSRRSSSSDMKDSVQTQRGVTLNVRCNLNEPEVTRRAKCAKKGTVFARSGCAMQCHHAGSAGTTHKRAVFASSLLKNVISKKMQFEQERKLERGEVCETHPALSPRFQLKDHNGDKDRSQERGFQRQPSESGSGFNSADDQHSLCSSCEPAEEPGRSKVPEDFKKSVFEPAKGLLSDTQHSNSSNGDNPEPVGELHPLSVSDAQTAKEGPETISIQSKLLFVPSCQLLSKKRFPKDLPGSGTGSGTGAPAASHQSHRNYSREETERGEKPPEIKICLRSVKENEGCALNIANLLTPKISYNSVGTFRTPGDADAKCHILSSFDKMPSFTVRDIRDTKCKFHTPIYHVRDVRKLVKSSYQFVSLDKRDGKCPTAADKLEEKEPVNAPPSPIVIKCQSVNTNIKPHTTEAPQKQAGSACHPAHSEHSPLHCVTSRLPYVGPRPPEVHPNADSKLINQSLEKFEPKEPKQAALEKLKAAVKTMEQLYVFDRNEWKRKTHTPRAAAESQPLPLVASEERGAEAEETKADRIPQSNAAAAAAAAGRPAEDKGARDVKSPCHADVSRTESRESTTFSNRSSLHFGKKTCASSVASAAPQSSMLQTSLAVENSHPAAAPLAVKIESQKNSRTEQSKIKISPITPAAAQAGSDWENYLTIPGLANAGRVKLPHHEPVSQELNPVLAEHPAVPSVLHHSGATTQQQVLCLSPSVPAVSPTPSTGDPQTQRKMLLDPTTGHYYLVDTPVQPPTRRLFDPETGQYVEVPMPHSLAAQVAPITPVPLSVSPLALSPAAYAPTYMIYPGFVPSPTLPVQAVFPKQQYLSDKTGGEVVSKSPRPDVTAPGSESAYYSATSEAPPGAPHQPGGPGHVTTRGGAMSSERKPVISITTQQGPRIIAPPSFDGTTMSFVVEHR